MGGYVGFPGLGLEFHIKRVAFHIFGWPLYWYGIIIACAVLACILLAVRNVKKVNLSPDTLYDYLIWAIPLSIVGARLYYVLSSWETYRSHPASILYIWEGGLAIYGAIIAAGHHIAGVLQMQKGASLRPDGRLLYQPDSGAGHRAAGGISSTRRHSAPPPRCRGGCGF